MTNLNGKVADIARAVRFMLEQPAHLTVPRLMMQPAQQPT